MTIHSKEDIIKTLEERYASLIQWFEQQASVDFNREIVPGKWTPAQQLDHLLRSTRPLNKALRMPQLTLRTMFGKVDRTEKSYEEIRAFYQVGLENGGRATGRYIPATDDNFDKAKMLEEFTQELKKLTGIINKWTEANLSAYLLPHPILGKLTIREMLFFTAYHTEHHFEHLKLMHIDA